MLHKTIIALAATVAVGCVPVATNASAAGHPSGHAGVAHVAGGRGITPRGGHAVVVARGGHQAGFARSGRVARYGRGYGGGPIYDGPVYSGYGGGPVYDGPIYNSCAGYGYGYGPGYGYNGCPRYAAPLGGVINGIFGGYDSYQY